MVHIHAVLPLALVALVSSIASFACGRDSPSAPSQTPGDNTPSAIASDAALFTLATTTQPFSLLATFLPWREPVPVERRALGGRGAGSGGVGGGRTILRRSPTDTYPDDPIASEVSE